MKYVDKASDVHKDKPNDKWSDTVKDKGLDIVKYGDKVSDADKPKDKVFGDVVKSVEKALIVVVKDNSKVVVTKPVKDKALTVVADKPKDKPKPKFVKDKSKQKVISEKQALTEAETMQKVKAEVEPSDVDKDHLLHFCFTRDENLNFVNEGEAADAELHDRMVFMNSGLSTPEKMATRALHGSPESIMP